MFSAVNEYSGPGFFSGWDFYGGLEGRKAAPRPSQPPSTFTGNTNFLNRTQAISQHLINVTESGTAILKVDNVTTAFGASPAFRDSAVLSSWMRSTFRLGVSPLVLLSGKTVTALIIHLKSALRRKKADRPWSDEGRSVRRAFEPSRILIYQNLSVSGSSIDISDWGRSMSRRAWIKASDRSHPHHLVLDISLCWNAYAVIFPRSILISNGASQAHAVYQKTASFVPRTTYMHIRLLPLPSRFTEIIQGEPGDDYDEAFFEINYVRTYGFETPPQPSLTSSDPPPARASYSVMVPPISENPAELGLNVAA
ncbi:hypothetical protein B0H17DRAFT_1125718 [Mycena rosella]|uniref:Uncharacterized protein n=1 Tax=Mycena rosella TaxID=1033263 RepID=A0AAD7GX09_MYCRO|nr:hypothetical protein B0H17DRAFT_1125718 [Mycena rosella]